MTNPTDPSKPAEGCRVTSCAGKFNFCFWAKLLIAIPAIPMIAITAAAFFEDPTAQSIAAIVAVIATVLLAVKIDQTPALQKKIFEKKD